MTPVTGPVDTANRGYKAISLCGPCFLFIEKPGFDQLDVGGAIHFAVKGAFDRASDRGLTGNIPTQYVREDVKTQRWENSVKKHAKRRENA